MAVQTVNLTAWLMVLMLVSIMVDLTDNCSVDTLVGLKEIHLGKWLVEKMAVYWDVYWVHL